MEGKRAAAIVALCMLMFLSSQQQVVANAANAFFCICYKICYNDCRRTAPDSICHHRCVPKCAKLNGQVATPTSAADCSKICLLISLCGTATTDTSGAATCVNDCTKNRSQYAKHH